jgi:two-component system, sensor histidine kinase and response regulator
MQQTQPLTVMAQLANTLLQHKNEIIEEWVKTSQEDPAIKSSIYLTHLQMVDHVPEMFNEICRILKEQPEHYRLRDARTHGHFRWKEGYGLNEVLYELGILRMVLLEYTIPFLRQYADNDQEIEVEVRKRIHHYLTEASIASAEQYDEEHKEESLRYQKQIEQILNSVGEGIYGLDAEGNTTFINPVAVKLLGWEADDLIGKFQHDLIHHSKPDNSPYSKEECPVYASLKDGTVHRVADEMYWRKDGTSIPVEYISTPIIENGEIVGAVVSFQDLTERKRMEAEKKQAEQDREKYYRQLNVERRLLNSILEQMPSGVHIAEAPSGKIIMGNRQAEKIAGHPIIPSPSTGEYGEYIGFHSDGRKVDPEEWPLARAITNGEIVTDQEFEYQRGDGSRIWIRVCAAPIRDRNGHIIAGVSIFQDITKSKRLEEELKHKNTQLESLNDSRLLFMRTISHEIANLLNAIVSPIGLLRMNLSEEQQQKMFNIIKRNTADMRTLLDQLMDFSAILAGQENIKIDFFNIKPVIIEIDDLMRPVAESKGIRFDVEIDPKLDCLASDELKIKRVIHNLVSNAIKYTQQGSVRLAVYLISNSHYGITVEDTGEGISEENLKKIFQEFQRFSGDTAIRGTGIGLAITKNLIELLQGSIAVKSTVGKGSRFDVVLPKVIEEE